MSLGYRGGSTAEPVSIRFHTIVAGSAAPAFVVTKMRPKLVPAQTTLLSDAASPNVEMRPPERSSPHGYGAGHETVHGELGEPAGGQSAFGPYVSRPRWPGSPIAFQSSQPSTAGRY